MSTALKNIPEVQEMYWLDALTSNAARGIQLRKLHPEMLEDEGVTIDVGGGLRVLYNKDYVFHVVVQKVLKPLSFITSDGSVKEKYLTEVFIPELVEYAQNQSEREAQQALRELAMQMSRFNGLSVEENMQRILDKDEEEE